MIKLRKTILVTLIVIAGLLFIAPRVLATVMTGDAPGVTSGDVLDDDLFVAGRDVAIDGTVNGDVYAAGNTVTVRGAIGGDLLVAAQTVVVHGEIGGSLRAAAQTIQLVGADVGGSVSVASRTFSVTDSEVGGGLVLAAQNATVRSPVNRGVTGAANNLTIASSVGKDVRVRVGQLNLSRGANVAGDIEYQSESEIMIDEDASVAGDISREVLEVTPQAPMELPFRIWAFLGALIVAAVLIYLMPKAFRGITDELAKRPVVNIAWGLLTLVLVPPALTILFVTVVGIPLALVLTGVYLVAIYLAKIFASYVAVTAAWKYFGFKSKNSYLLIAVGLAAYYLLLFVPIIGWLVRVAFLLGGLGAVTLYSVQAVKVKKARAKV